jgi:hypothetical protein
MPTFQTPAPIAVTVELGVGDLRIVAGERTDTVVAVRPSDPTRKSDASAAEQTRVEFDGARLLIRAPRGWRLRGGDSVDVEIDLPGGSQVRAEAGIAALRATGRLGECRMKTGIGEIRLGEVGPAVVRTGIGDVTIDRVVDQLELTTRSGAVQIATLDGSGAIKNANGDSWVGQVTGELVVNAANGRITVDQAQAGVTAKTANGDVRLGEVARGAILAETANGKVAIAIREGVAAWLDLHTHYGNVHNTLDAAAHPDPGDETVEVRVRTSFGDIDVSRAGVSGPAGVARY